MDKVIHSIAGEVMVHTTSNYKITADLDDLRLTRQKFFQNLQPVRLAGAGLL
jgi:hypothetical protein